jgi:tripartite-type tricarboxylate transporter receptor subunit TctC
MLPVRFVRGFCLSVLLGWAALLPSAAGAQGQYPDKPIRLIVPQAPGSATDTVARILASELGPQLGQTVIIENKPGAAFTIGLDLVAKAPPDGYTLGLGPIGALSISPNMIAKIPYSIEKDFAPVALVARGHLLLAVAPTSEYKTVKDLIAASKKDPGKMTNASSASGSPGHVGAELFKYMAGVDAVHVPYRGGAAATTDLIAGRVTFMFESLNSIAPHAKSGAVRALGVSGDRRSPAFPDVPTVAEAGVPGYSSPTWSGVIAPAGTPKAIVDKINDAVNKAIKTQAFKDRFGSIGDEPAGGTPEEFANTIRTDLAKWKDVVQRSGAKLE